LEAKHEYIELLEWILVVFEDLFGMKINFEKCEMISLNICMKEGQQLANILRCKLVTPIKYLPVSLQLSNLI
jgi:hypothetical protein